MAFISSVVSGESRDRIGRKMLRMLERGAAPDSESSEIFVTDLFPRYSLSWERMIERGVLGASQVGWWAMLFLGDMLVAAFDMTGDLENLSVEACREGEDVPELSKALETAQEIAATGMYELGLLEAPELAFAALLLRSEDDSKIISLVEEESLGPGRAQSLTEVEPLLLERAQDQLLVIEFRNRERGKKETSPGE